MADPRAQITVRWHTLTPDDVVARLATDRRGLSAEEAARRLREYGPNRPAVTKAEPWWAEILEELREPMILLLLAVGAVYFVIGEQRDALAVIAITAAILGVELITELRAKRAIVALGSLSSPVAPVLRDGAPREVSPDTVVPGDIVLLRPGERVPADLRLLEASGLRVDESPLTGESAGTVKHTLAKLAPEAELGERLTMAYAGTLILGGNGQGIVVATGAATELGRIGRLVADVREARTPLQLEMGQLARTLVWVALGFSVALPVLGVFIAGMSLEDAVLSGLTLAFATIPEELPILITVVLALGALQLARRQAIVKRLVAAETLGSVTVICTDKTGTLTQNEMAAVEGWIDGRRVMREELAHDPIGLRLVSAGVLANDAQALRQDGKLSFQGDPTETALLALAEERGLAVGRLRGGAEVIEEWPFDETRKRMSVLYRTGGEVRLAMKGSVETVLAVATRRATGDADAALDDGAKGQILAAAEKLAGQGLRVLAFADRRQADGEAVDEHRVTFLGLIALQDPPRPEAHGAIAEVRGAGIRVMMLTGDHAATARAIAVQVGLDGASALAGRDVERMSEADLTQALATTSVFARIAPEHKLRIVQALQKNGEIVAVTGDGVNDAPALKQAAIGVAMGRGGSDVARETADLILADDNFATIAAAVREGRRLHANLRKAVSFFLAAKVGVIAASLVAVFAGAPLPFAPIQLILMESVMDVFASVTFTAEPGEGDLMRLPPRRRHGRFLDAALARRIVAGGLALGAAVTLSYLSVWVGSGDQRLAQTSAFVAWMAGHAALALVMRTERQLVTDPFANRPYLVWALASLGVIAATQAVPAVTELLHAATLDTRTLLVALGTGIGFPFVLALLRLRRAERGAEHGPSPAGPD